MKIKAILWDFDGVIIKSLHQRDASIRYALKEFSDKDVNKLITYHKQNSGISRFGKFKYFFENILHQKINSKELQQYSNKVTNFVKNKINKDMLITEIIDFIKLNQNIDMHIISASADVELKYFCNKMDIAKYFITINGSQNELSTKTITAGNIINIFEYNLDEVILVGDSINDYNAAKNNDIQFLAYNFRNYKDLTKKVIKFKTYFKKVF